MGNTEELLKLYKSLVSMHRAAGTWLQLGNPYIVRAEEVAEAYVVLQKHQEKALEILYLLNVECESQQAWIAELTEMHAALDKVFLPDLLTLKERIEAFCREVEQRVSSEPKKGDPIDFLPGVDPALLKEVLTKAKSDTPAFRQADDDRRRKSLGFFAKELIRAHRLTVTPHEFIAAALAFYKMQQAA